ncbi:hypothetical protein ABZ915_23135 [Streptomyces sp. NPDC046915]|uniref:hypothetical protein n=1 Tax=Streptomyces sp. NPDC046915 TaxID=3155257 RepID=UPI0033E0BE8F
MIIQISHTVTGTDPAGITLALEVAYDLHAPVPPPRAPEVATPELMGLRIPATRPHRHKVPLKRLTTMPG